ncbi:MAG: glycosyltransferase family 4 protein, partial [Desulfomonilaceae bacterium]
SFEMFNRSESVYDPGKSSFHRRMLKIKRAWNLFKNLWYGEYDFIHIHGSTSGFLGDTLVMIVAFITGSKVLLHLHGTDWERFYGSVSSFRCFYVRIGLLIPRRIAVLYDLWAQNIRKIDPRINVRVIRNFVPDCPSPGHERLTLLRKDLAIRDDEFVISSIGRVGWRKGSFDIVEAAKKVVGECKDFKILLVGGEEDVGEMNQLKEAVNKNQLDQWVKLIGEVDIEDVPLFLGITNIFLLPSYYEGMPMSIIEAMRSGKAIISTKVGAIPDMIESGVSGILINPGSPDEIVDSILTLKGDIALREKLSSQARKAFESGFETSHVLLSLMELYQEMVDN